jgi:hypothetical protein
LSDFQQAAFWVLISPVVLVIVALLEAALIYLIFHMLVNVSY